MTSPSPVKTFTHLRFAVALALLCSLLFPSYAADEKKISIYSNVANYTLPVIEREGHEYVGMLEVLDQHRIRAVLAVNGSAIAHYEPIARAALDRGWEFIGHGFTQKSMQKVADERDDIRKTAAAIRVFTGERPRGWLGPGLTETWETPDILSEEGYDYVADWVLDDQPVWLKTRGKPILSVPYTQENNDVAMMLIQHHKASEYYERAIDQFEQIHKDAKGSARCMALSVHPYLMGAAHRVKYFRQVIALIAAKKDVAFMTGGEIADWYVNEAGPSA